VIKVFEHAFLSWIYKATEQQGNFHYTMHDDLRRRRASEGSGRADDGNESGGSELHLDYAEVMDQQWDCEGKGEGNILFGRYIR
jgi:hypothetical protein